MSQQDLLTTVVRVLEESGISYLVTGSIASSMQGEPRATHDIDLVVALDTAEARRLAAAFPAPRYYVDETAAIEAVRSRTTFNLLDSEEGDKVDFWLMTDDPFDHSRFERRRRVETLGLQLWVSSPEDTILMKLRWAAQASGSEKQLTDALRVYEVQARTLDRAYLDRWAHSLGVTDLWSQLLDKAEPL